VTVRVVSARERASTSNCRACATRLRPGSSAVTSETVTIEWGRKKIR
jgi:hypothetical protein